MKCSTSRWIALSSGQLFWLKAVYSEELTYFGLPRDIAHVDKSLLIFKFRCKRSKSNQTYVKDGDLYILNVEKMKRLRVKIKANQVKTLVRASLAHIIVMPPLMLLVPNLLM